MHYSSWSGTYLTKLQKFSQSQKIHSEPFYFWMHTLNAMSIVVNSYRLRLGNAPTTFGAVNRIFVAVSLRGWRGELPRLNDFRYC